MIDYDKLKLAHELCFKVDRGIKHLVDVSTFSGNIVNRFYLMHLGTEEACDGIDDLIDKLHELTRPKPKYEVGAEIFCLKKHGLLGFMLGIIQNYQEETGNYYATFSGFGGYWLGPQEIYPTKQSLIEAQIEYWNKMNCADGRHQDCEEDNTCIWCEKELIDEPIPSTQCPKCGLQCVQDGICWNLDCNYRECEHESNGITYAKRKIRSTDNDTEYKCKHCGEFYSE